MNPDQSNTSFSASVSDLDAESLEHLIKAQQEGSMKFEYTGYHPTPEQEKLLRERELEGMNELLKKRREMGGGVRLPGISLQTP